MDGKVIEFGWKAHFGFFWRNLWSFTKFSLIIFSGITSTDTIYTSHKISKYSVRNNSNLVSSKKIPNQKSKSPICPSFHFLKNIAIKYFFFFRQSTLMKWKFFYYFSFHNFPFLISLPCLILFFLAAGQIRNQIKMK